MPPARNRIYVAMHSGLRARRVGLRAFECIDGQPHRMARPRVHGAIATEHRQISRGNR